MLLKPLGHLSAFGINDLRVVYGAADPKAGYCGSLADVVRDPRLNHRLEVTAGVLADECGRVLRAFFGRLREQVR